MMPLLATTRESMAVGGGGPSGSGNAARLPSSERSRMAMFLPAGRTSSARPRKVDEALMVVLVAVMLRSWASAGSVISREISMTPVGSVTAPVLVWSAVRRRASGVCWAKQRKRAAE